MRFFRVQGKGISFKEMCTYRSDCGGEYEESHGLAVSTSPDGLDGGSRFGGAWDAMNDDDELIILEGTVVARIYDGYLVRPTKEIARFKIAEWETMLESGEAWEYE